MSKTELAEILASKIRTGENAYVAGTAKVYAQVMGYEAPTRSMVETRIIPVSVSAWLDGVDADATVIDVTPEPPLLSPPTPHATLAPADSGTPIATSTDRASDEPKR